MLKFFRFIPLQLTICIVVGILFGYYFKIQPTVLYLLLGTVIPVFLGVYFYAYKKYEPSKLFTTFTFLIAFLIGLAAVTFKNTQNKPNFYANQESFSLSKPQTSILFIRKVLKPTNYSYKYEAEVVQLNTENTIGKVLLNVTKDSLIQALNVDDKIVVNTLFNEISAPKNPFEFNYKNYLKNQQIYYQIYLNDNEYLKVDSSTTLIGIAAKIRAKINLALVNNGFKNDELAVIDALLLGQRQDISNELLQSYIGAGAIHILAVSGLHVGIILLLLSFLLKPLHYFKRGKLMAITITVVSLWLFAILAGLSASVVRAVTMFTAIAIGMYANRNSTVYHALIISFFFLVLFNPYYVFEVGFQLSYLAVFAIVWIQPKLYSLWQPKLWLVNKLWQLLTVSIAAQIGVLPLSLYYFHQFPALFFISNLVIIPFLGIILGLGILVIVLAVINVLPSFLAESYQFIIHKMNSFISWISNQEAFVIQQITFSFALLLTSYLLIFSFFKYIEKRNFKRMLLLLFSIIVVQTIFIAEKYHLQTTNTFIVFNKSRESILGNRKGERILIKTSMTEFDTTKNLLKNYLVGIGVSNIEILNNKNKLNFFKDETILVVDSLGIYNFKSIDPTIIVLQQSPKINLDRLMQVLKPKLIVSDGSNYKSYTQKWEESCRKNKTPFHNTMQNGALLLN